ncbi:MAG: hypothetical protein GY756_14475 [bacterium]|nr:hypothetical protein [bacterium]
MNYFDSPGHSECYAVTVNDLNEIIVAGYLTEGSYHSQKNTFISKLDSLGNILNNQLINSLYYISYSSGSIRRKQWDITSSNRDVYITAGLYDTVQIGHLNFTSQGEWDAAIIKFNEIGYPQWFSAARGNEKDIGKRISACDDIIYFAGDYSSNELKFGDISILNNSGNNNSDFFLSKMNDKSFNSCPPVDDFEITYPETFCDGDSILLTIENKYATYTKWYCNNNELNYNNKKSIYIKESGRYTVRINENTECPVPILEVIADNKFNEGDNTDIIIYSKPLTKIISSEKTCVGDTLSISTHNDSDYIYRWEITKSFEYADTLVYADTLSHELYYKLDNTIDSMAFFLDVENKYTGCICKDSVFINVDPLPNVELKVLRNKISAFYENAISFQWFMDDSELFEFENKDVIHEFHSKTINILSP